MKTHLQRFEEHFDRGQEDKCWNWKHSKVRGYGRFMMDRRAMYGARASLILLCDDDQPDMCALHKQYPLRTDVGVVSWLMS